ncbi:MAG: DMT family transporter [Chloroflexota bacterium]
MTAVKTQTQPENPRTSVYLILVIGVISISFAAIFIRYAQAAGMPSILIAGARMVFAALLLTPMTLRRHMAELRRVSTVDWLLMVTSGFFLAVHFASWVASLEHTTVLISVTLVTTVPIWTALLEMFVLRVRLKQILLIGLGITIIGGFLVAIPSGEPVADTTTGNTPLGAFLATIGAVTVAAYLVIGRKVQQKLSLLPYIWIVYGMAGVFLVIVIGVQQVPLTGYGWVAWANILAMAIFPQLVGHTSLNYAVKYISATYVSIITKLEPIASAILAYFLFTEVPGRWAIIGSVIITAGVLLASLDREKKLE